MNQLEWNCWILLKILVWSLSKWSFRACCFNKSLTEKYLKAQCAHHQSSQLGSIYSRSNPKWSHYSIRKVGERTLFSLSFRFAFNPNRCEPKLEKGIYSYLFCTRNFHIPWECHIGLKRRVVKLAVVSAANYARNELRIQYTRTNN